MSTNVLSAKDIKRTWHQVDAKDQTLGRLATGVATILMGKNKANFVPYLDNGDFVVVTNASLVKVTGKKASQKKYVRHSGYPGGLKVEVYSDLQKRRPEEIIRHAVKGMIPHTKLGDKMIKKLYIYAGSENPHKNKFEKGEVSE
jgi:large subunit ribosomal protein L13